MRDKFTLKVGAGLTLNGITFDNLDSIVGKILRIYDSRLKYK